jgi:hypothetical protein
MKEERIASSNHHCVKIEFDDAADLKVFSQGSNLNDSNNIDLGRKARKNSKPKKGKNSRFPELYD